MSFDWTAEGIDVNALHGMGEEQKSPCPKCSATRTKKTDKCLNVNVATGVFHCWHCDWGGKAKDTNDEYRIERPRPAPKPFTRPDVIPGAITTAATRWFASRGIPLDVLHRNRITTISIFMPQVGAETIAVSFPYYRNGEAINCKYRDSEKHFRMVSGAERLLYGFDDIAPTTVIVEGEMDKLAIEVAGMLNCVSVPDGAPPANAKNIEAKFDYLGDERLKSVERWVIAVDNDPPGVRLSEELVRRFGAERCSLVTWPENCKDANDVLMAHGPQVLRECLDGAKPVPIVGVFDAETFAEEYLRMYDEGVPRGLSTGWDCVDENWRVQPGQLLVVTGIPGHGKSEWVDALCVNLAYAYGWACALYSPENHPVRLHMMKLAEKYIEKPFNDGIITRMSRADAERAKDWMQQHFHWIMPERPSLDEIIDKARALVFARGIRVLVIDPWNEVEINRPGGMTESEYVANSLMTLRKFARKHEVLVIVVAHPRLIEKKSDGSYPVPTPYDISGGAMWRNKADNCIAIYAVTNDKRGSVEVHVQKVKFKNFGQVGMVPMMWDRPTGRYFPRLI